MALPIKPPLPPMEALAVDEIPEGDEWQYEPKWDGFRCVVFRDGDDIYLQSKAGQPLARYFPEVVQTMKAVKARQYVMDGELVIPAGNAFSFDQLLQRLHPAAKRVQKLAAETPSIFIAFDLLAEGKRSLLGEPLSVRRAELENFARKNFHAESLRLSPAVRELRSAQAWLRKVGETLDGIIAKRSDLPYRSGERDGMQKIKNYRSADCVVGGFRYATGKPVVGSLLLGLYDEEGLLHHVGFTSSFKATERPAITRQVEALISKPGFTGRAPGGPSRWAPERAADWRPLRPELVVEVCYDHFTGGRFRHGTKLLRWRPDKAPRQCTLDQIEQPRGDLLKLLAA